MRRDRIISKRGFTLLELLLVVFILSAIALSTVSFTNNADEQFRYEETQRRLLNIRRAVIGEEQATFGGQRLLTGYVVDNGLLPADLKALVEQPPSLPDGFDVKIPQFDPEPDPATGLNNGGEIALDALTEQLFKGYRGSYLTVIPGSSKEYRDGWGNDPGAGLDFGWVVTPTPPDLTITSLGSDGQPGEMLPGTDYDKDVSDTTQAVDWKHDVQGWQVRLKNASGVDITAILRVSLLVYRNGQGWKRVTTNPLSCLDGDGDGLVGGSPCTGFADLSFPDLTLTIPTDDISIGQHLLVVVQDPDGTPHTPDDLPFTSSGVRITQRVEFFGRTVLPTVEVVIR